MNTEWHTYSAKCSDTPLLVEPGGIEPPSENHSSQLSPSAADRLGFPSPNAERQAFGYGRCKAVACAAPSARSRSPLIDASFPTAVLRDETAA